MFENKTLLITGGTGSFGNAVLRRFLASDLAAIRVFSRDEKKQDDMRKRYADPKLKFILGDVRDRSSIIDAMAGVDFVFHAAALKQVPSCEFFPLEAVKTNIIGTANTIDAATQAGVRRLICLSTDKAVYPVNAMGISKAMMEKVAQAKARSIDPSKLTICCTRYGNVMASRGSVIPLFAAQIQSGQPITITDPDMTRFMMTIDDAVDLVLFGFAHGESGDVLVQKAPAATILTLAQALRELLDRANHPIRIIGTRHGEKKHESLLSREEMAKAQDLGRYYRIPPDPRDLNYTQYFEAGETAITETDDYTSANATMLDIEGMKKMLQRIELDSIASIGAIADREP
ncbi:MAG: polysaccharide biosynthesis protein [Terriglobia bacterium]|nr:polysaccharide biosynthesis protein [Terriglobia bacterium]